MEYKRPMEFGYMRPPRTCFNKPYEGYSYLEDLMCWCIGVRANQTKHKYCPDISIDVWYCGITGQWKSTIDEGYNCIETNFADSPIEALEKLLLELKEA